MIGRSMKQVRILRRPSEGRGSRRRCISKRENLESNIPFFLARRSKRFIINFDALLFFSLFSSEGRKGKGAGRDREWEGRKGREGVGGRGRRRYLQPTLRSCLSDLTEGRYTVKWYSYYGMVCFHFLYGGNCLNVWRLLYSLDVVSDILFI